MEKSGGTWPLLLGRLLWLVLFVLCWLLVGEEVLLLPLLAAAEDVASLQVGDELLDGLLLAALRAAGHHRRVAVRPLCRKRTEYMADTLNRQDLLLRVLQVHGEVLT